MRSPISPDVPFTWKTKTIEDVCRQNAKESAANAASVRSWAGACGPEDRPFAEELATLSQRMADIGQSVAELAERTMTALTLSRK